MPDRLVHARPPQADPDFRAWANRVCAHFWDRAVLLLVGATLAWWPLDELVFTRDAADRRVLITMRVGLVLSLLGSRWLLRHTRVGRAYTNEVVAACLLPILTWVGWSLWTSSPLTGPVVGFVAAIPLLSIPLLLSLRVRIAVVTGTTATVFAAWLSQRPGVLADPDVAAGISYAVANVAAAAVVGHAWYRRVADHHRRGQLLAASEAELRGLQTALEARVRLQTSALRELYDRLESAREEERRAIARELHDELGQDLMGLRLSVQLMRTSLGPSAQAWSEELGATLDRSADSVRRLLAIVRPPVHAADLPEGVARLVAQAQLRAGVTVDVHLDDVPEVLAPTVYRIVQEALTNVCRHTAAGRVGVTVRVGASEVSVLVEDDGPGIPEEPGRGLGLVGIRERASEWGGTAVWGSRNGGFVEVHLPIHGSPLPS